MAAANQDPTVQLLSLKGLVQRSDPKDQIQYQYVIDTANKLLASKSSAVPAEVVPVLVLGSANQTEAIDALTKGIDFAAMPAERSRRPAVVAVARLRPPAPWRRDGSIPSSSAPASRPTCAGPSWPWPNSPMNAPLC